MKIPNDKTPSLKNLAADAVVNQVIHDHLKPEAKPKEVDPEVLRLSRAMMRHEIKHYIMQAIDFGDYHMAKHLVDQLRNWEDR